MKFVLDSLIQFLLFILDRRIVEQLQNISKKFVGLLNLIPSFLHYYYYLDTRCLKRKKSAGHQFDQNLIGYCFEHGRTDGENG